MNETLKGVKGDTGKTLEKQDTTIEILKSVKGETSKMIEKQDTTVEILRGVSEDVGVIREDIGEIKDALIIITGIREETKELMEKYEILSRDVGEIKAVLKLEEEGNESKKL